MPDTTNLPTVAPVEGWYGMTRDGWIAGPFKLGKVDPVCYFGNRYDYWNEAGAGYDDYRDVPDRNLDIIAVAPPAVVVALFGLVGNDAPPPQED